MTFFYDVHSLLTLASDVALPELAAFAKPAGDRRASIRVRVGGWGARPRCEGDDRLSYDEMLGRFGFAIDIAFGGTIEIEASHLLRHSPHVLYTNVVEPVLRWTFVRKGWALVHGACFASGNDAYLITAQTDTGKTTTVLTLLRRYPQLAFLADDLCLVRDDGRVLDFPKPMTISRHTLRAVNSKVLSRRERAALVVQSRVHSRSGRRLAQMLSRTGLPMATVNAVVQRVVPPPKFAIGRLLPDVKTSHGARLRGMFLIQRGATESTRDLDLETAMEKLHANCEDAFGFPPYEALESRLRHHDGRDWRERERAIARAAFTGQRATLLESSRFEWWQRIATAIERPNERPHQATVAVASAR